MSMTSCLLKLYDMIIFDYVACLFGKRMSDTGEHDETSN
jgi:hypothetical protein